MVVTFYYNKSKIQIFKVFSGTLDGIIQMHAHAKTGYEIHFIDDGRGTLDTGEKQYDLHKNILYVTGPNVAHRQIPDSKEPMHELCVYFKITGSANGDSAVRAFASNPFWIGESNAAVKKLFKDLVKENENDDMWHDSVLSSLAIRLIVEMTRMYCDRDKTSKKPSESTDLNESRSWILDKILLDDCTQLTLSDLAKSMGVCQRQAERIIKEYYDSSFKQLKFESKMAMAATLLEEEDISIEKCALRCSYNSTTAFSSAFKRKYNMTPMEYKKSLK